MLPLSSYTVQQMSVQSPIRQIVTASLQAIKSTATAAAVAATANSGSTSTQTGKALKATPSGVSAIVLHTLVPESSTTTSTDTTAATSTTAEEQTIDVNPSTRISFETSTQPTRGTGPGGQAPAPAPAPAPDSTPVQHPARPDKGKDKATLPHDPDQDHATRVSGTSSATALSKIVSVAEIIKRTYLAEAVAAAETQLQRDTAARRTSASEIEPGSTEGILGESGERGQHDETAQKQVLASSKSKGKKQRVEMRTAVGLHQYTYLGALENLFREADQDESDLITANRLSEKGDSSSRKRTRSAAETSTVTGGQNDIGAQHDAIAREWLGLGPETLASGGQVELGQGRAGKNKRPRMKHSPFLVIVLSIRPIHALARATEYTYQPPEKVRVGGLEAKSRESVQVRPSTGGEREGIPATSDGAGNSVIESRGTVGVQAGTAERKARSRKRVRRKKTAGEVNGNSSREKGDQTHSVAETSTVAMEETA